MKKITVTILLSLFCFSFAFANDIMQPSGNEKIPIENYNKENLVPAYKYNSRDNTPVPEYEFIKLPEAIMTSYYDYMPGSYEGYPIRYQADIDAHGHYLTWFARPSGTANRRQYWAYYDADENIVDWLTISTDDVWQGYGGFAIHPATGDAIATWHQEHAVLGYGTTICYDDFALLGIPGFWSCMFIPPDEPGGNEYIWPLVYVGPSPLGEDYVRVYQTAKNYLSAPSGNPCEDTRIMYCDVENSLFADMTVLLDLANWTEVLVMYDQNWREKDCRPLSQPFAIDPNTPGKVAIMGYVSWLSGNLGEMPVDPGVFVWESYDYGETWDVADLHSDGPEDYLYLVDNIPGFTDSQGNLLDFLEVDVYGWHNTSRYDNEGNLHLTYLQGYGFTDPTGGYYFGHFMPQAEAIWDGTEFTFDEVPEMPGIDPLSGHSVPWEIVTDPFSGELDTLLYVVVGWSLYEDELFHENTEKNAVNLENGWLLQMWADGTYSQLAQDGIPQWLPYLEHPIIFISVSGDNGNTWSEPIELTDIFDENGEPTQFYDQITVYPYVCDQIIDLGDNWGQVNMYYFDDNTWGSSVIQNLPPDDGGQITYCCIKIKFPTIGTIEGTVTLNGGSGNVEEVEVTAGGIIVNPYNDNGSYRITIPSGIYDVTASLTGYVDSTIVGVVVNGGEPTYVDFTLNPDGQSVDDDSILSTELMLNQNSPNPFTSYTHISFSVPKGFKNPSIKIYNLKGQLIKTLEPSIGSNHSEGYATWDGKDSNNNDVVSGIYLYKLQTDNGSIIKKMLLTR